MPGTSAWGAEGRWFESTRSGQIPEKKPTVCLRLVHCLLWFVRRIRWLILDPETAHKTLLAICLRNNAVPAYCLRVDPPGAQDRSARLVARRRFTFHILARLTIGIEAVLHRQRLALRAKRYSPGSATTEKWMALATGLSGTLCARHHGGAIAHNTVINRGSVSLIICCAGAAGGCFFLKITKSHQLSLSGYCFADPG